MFDVVIPLKALAEAKSRLASCLTPVQRRQLAIAMASDVINVLSRWSALGQIRVVAGAGWSTDLLPPQRKLTWVFETPQAYGMSAKHAAGSLNNALEEGVSGCDGRPLLVIHGDLPLLDLSHLKAVEAAIDQGADAVLASDRHGQGTNMLGVAVAEQAIFHFGYRSLAKHIAHMTRAGMAYQQLDGLGLTHDVDTAADFDHLMAVRRQGGFVGTATRDCLDSWHPPERPMEDLVFPGHLSSSATWFGEFA